LEYTKVHAWGPWKRALVYGLGAFLFLRLFTLAWGLVTESLFPMPALPLSSPYMHGFVPTPDEQASPLAEIWLRWDATWYLSIAQSGYRAGDGSVAFFPLYPLLTSGLGRLLGGRFLWAGLILSNLAAAAFFVLFFRLASDIRGPEAGRPALEVLVTFPTAFFLVMPYTESLFLLLTVTTFWLWQRGKWLAAGLVGALAAFTRAHGLLLLPALLVAWFLDSPGRQVVARLFGKKGDPASPARWRWGALLPLALIPAATLLYAGYASLYVQHAPFWTAQQWGWGEHWTWPWLALWGGLRNMGETGVYGLLSLFSVMLVALPLLAGLKKLPVHLLLYSLMVLLLSMSRVDSQGVLVSLHRYVLMVFPAFILLGEILKRGRPTWFLWRWLCLVVQAFGTVAFVLWGGVW
jgi:hypothetical protein